jgi:hypothetical protein
MTTWSNFQVTLSSAAQIEAFLSNVLKCVDKTGPEEKQMFPWLLDVQESQDYYL